MSGLTALSKRLKALEARYSPREKLVIRGGLPSGAQMIAAAAQVREPRCPELADEDADQNQSTPAKGPRAPVNEPPLTQCRVSLSN